MGLKSVQTEALPSFLGTPQAPMMSDSRVLDPGFERRLSISAGTGDP